MILRISRILKIPVKIHSHRQHSDRQTHRHCIGKNRNCIFFFFLLCFFRNDLSEILHSLIFIFFCQIRLKLLVFLHHIILHTGIFLIIQIITFQSYHGIVLITKKSIFTFLRFHKHQYFFSSEMLQMYFFQKLCCLHRYPWLRKEPANNLLIFKIFLLVFVNLFPDLHRKVHMIHSSFHIFCHNSSSDKQICCSCLPFYFSCKYSNPSLLYLLVFFCPGQPYQKCIYIILHIDFVFFSCHSYLPYISGQAKSFLPLLYIWIFLLINYFYHFQITPSAIRIAYRNCGFYQIVRAISKNLPTDFASCINSIH